MTTAVACSLLLILPPLQPEKPADMSNMLKCESMPQCMVVLSPSIYRKKLVVQLHNGACYIIGISPGLKNSVFYRVPSM